MVIIAVVFVLGLIFLRLRKTYYYLAAYDSVGVRSHALELITKYLLVVSLAINLVIAGSLSLTAALVADEPGLISTWLVILSGFLLAALASLLPPGRLSIFLALQLAKILAYFLTRFGRQAQKLEKSLKTLRKRFHTTEPISRQSLMDLLIEQKDIAEVELSNDIRLILRTLSLNSQKISDLMIKKSKLILISVNAAIGPVLLTELHNTKRQTFLLADKDEIIGTVRLQNLAELKSGGKAGQALSESVIRVPKDAALIVAVEEFIENQEQLLLVIDSNDKIVGAIYLEDVLAVLVND